MKCAHSLTVSPILVVRPCFSEAIWCHLLYEWHKHVYFLKMIILLHNFAFLDDSFDL